MSSFPPGRLAGKRCVVTGAAQGIALAATKAFLREGAQVMAVDVNKDKLDAMSDAPGLTRRVLDVRDREGVMKLAQDYQGVNVLFNCAGYVHIGTIMESSLEDWEKSFDVNVTSMLHFIHAFVPQMRAAGGGSVINMASVVSHLGAVPQRGVYGATKAAVVGLTKGLATEEIRNNIRVNAVCPGPVATEAFQDRAGSEENVDTEVRKKVCERLLGRLPTAEELTGLLVYLASDESWNQTGSVVTCDGGFSCVF
ncbi:3-hydroxybutyrate dehydrogenase type 2 [Hyalella azteca]|uniref:Dehydrogenase/reductase SDR family member 6 n=1 Tax=Hyalella azteca TaxID=294128 RepID=A0A8B7NIQ5_HYAAZ|nr:3-hydroxybutyrate dehydrogenase type 2 [Hyalella azteca]